MRRRWKNAVVAVFLVSGMALAMPSEPVVRVELSSYQGLTADVAALANHVQNPMLNMGLMAFGNFIGAPGLLGIDPARPIQLAVFAEGGDWTKAERVLVLPLLNEGKEYLSGLGVSYETLQDDGATRRLRANRPVQSFREMSVRIVGDRAVVSPSAPLVEKVAAGLAADADALVPGGISGTLRVRLDVAAVLPALRRQMDEQARAADAMGGVEGKDVADAARDMQRQYVEGMLDVLEQAQTLGFGLQCNAEGLTVYARLDVLPETVLAKMFGEMVPPPERLVRLLPADATMVYAGGTMGALVRHGMEPYMAFAGKMMDVQMEMMRTVGGGAEVPAVDFKALFEKTKGFYKGYGDGAVVSVGPSGQGKGIVFFEAVEVTDSDAILKALDEGVGLANEMYAQMKIPITFDRRADRTAGGVAVRVLGAAFQKPDAKAVEAAAGKDAKEAADAGADAEGGDLDLAGMQEAMWLGMADQMAWLGKGVMEVAVTDGVLLMAMGQPGCLDPFLDRLRTPPEAVWPARSQALFPEIKNHGKAAEFWVAKPMELVKGLVPVFDPDGEAAALLAQLPDGGAGVGGLTMASPTAAMGAFRVSATSLTAFAKAIQAVQRNQRGNADGGETRPPEVPAAGPPVDVVLPQE